MARTDTAGFYKFAQFYWHKKWKQEYDPWCLPADCPNVEPDFCEECYKQQWPDAICDAVKKTCKKRCTDCWWSSGGGTTIDCTDPKIRCYEKTEQFTPSNPPTVECYSYQNINNWTRYTASWMITWRDSNSWTLFKFSWECYSKISFEWRLNSIAANNLIYYWATEQYAAFRTWDATNNDDLFRFTIRWDWYIVIEISRKASASTYYTYEVYETHITPWADYRGPLIAWVQWWAQIWNIVLWDNVWTPTVLQPVPEALAVWQESTNTYDENRVYWHVTTSDWVPWKTETFLWYTDVGNVVPSSWIYYKDWELIVPAWSGLTYHWINDEYLPNIYHWWSNDVTWWLMDIKFTLVADSDQRVTIEYWTIQVWQSNPYQTDWFIENEWLEPWDYRFQLEIFRDWPQQDYEPKAYIKLYKLNGSNQWTLVKQENTRFWYPSSESAPDEYWWFYMEMDRPYSYNWEKLVLTYARSGYFNNSMY